MPRLCCCLCICVDADRACLTTWPAGIRGTRLQPACVGLYLLTIRYAFRWESLPYTSSLGTTRPLGGPVVDLRFGLAGCLVRVGITQGGTGACICLAGMPPAPQERALSMGIVACTPLWIIGTQDMPGACAVKSSFIRGGGL